MSMTETVLVIGSGSDLAAELAMQYARQGARLYLMGRNEARLKQLESGLAQAGACEVHAMQFDILEYDRFCGLLGSLKHPPDVSIVAVGMMPSDAHSAEVAQEMMRVNAEAPAMVCERLAAYLSDLQHASVIIGVSSLAGIRGRASNYAYGAAKAAFTAYLSGLRNRYCGSPVHIMTVLPGFVRTKMIAKIHPPDFLTVDVETLAQRIRAAVNQRRNIVYSSWIWRWIALVFLAIPEPIFKRLEL